MLRALHIENIAVIRRTDIDFSDGFSVLSGETGAGKSILIDSIAFLLGRRSGRELLRTGKDRAVVSALFTVLDPRHAILLSELGAAIDESGELLLERTLTADGRTSSRIGGRPATLAQLRSIGEVLVSIHGQSDTHTLTERANQLAILDGYADNRAHLDEYRALYERLVAVREEIRKIEEAEASRERELEMLRFQIADIEGVMPKSGEEEKLLDKKKRLKSVERIAKQSGFAYRALRSAEKANVLYILERAITAVQSLSDVIGEAEEIASELLDCRVRIEDAAERVYAFTEEDAENAERILNQVENRLAATERLKRKYGGSVDAVLSYLEEAKERLLLLENADSRLGALRREEETLVRGATAAAEKLTLTRKEAGEKLAEGVLSVLAFLDMPRVLFEVSVLPRGTEGRPDFCRDGADTVEFLLATNPGEPLLPLSSIASGGELARIMLAIKSVISDRDGIETVIYDEIDTGVSGKTARKIGIELLRSAHGAQQVLCVTHSAQIASLADAHYLIKKSEEDGRAETQVVPLDEDGRISELSRILGGIEVTDAQRRAAWELYTERSVYQGE